MKERLRHLRLLPRDPSVGWTAYAWLVYLLPFIVDPFYTNGSTMRIAATLASVVLFLVLYFAAYWSTGRRLLLIIAAMTLIGVAFLPFNRGAAVFFIFAASFAPWVDEAGSSATRIIAAVVMVLTVEALALQLQPFRWIWGLFFALMVGALNVHAAQGSRRNARLRVAQFEVETLAKSAERERIARDLHDLLGHTLSLIVLKSELASKLADRDPQRAITEIRDVEKISRDALTQVRAAVTGYRAPGLDTELENAREALAAASVRLDVQREEEVAFTRGEEAVLALVLREAVTNVIRHARATRCIVTLARRDAERHIAIEDDGGARMMREGAGLSGMRERVEAIGGRLDLSTGGGMRIRVALPVTTLESPQ